MKFATLTGLTLSAIVALGLATTPGAFAKGHDQGNSAEPGSDVGATTGGAQGLGADASGGKGKGAQGNTGNSANAGKGANEGGGDDPDTAE